MPARALKIFDVNLRQQFYSQARIERSLELANVLKVSDEELPVMASMLGLGGTVTYQLAALRKRFDLRLVAYTRGGKGSLLVTDTEQHEHPGHPTDVVDTIGAGDSFTATLCAGLLNDVPLPELNNHANLVAAFVCSQKGATPTLPTHLKNTTP
jgi:fructokinase